MLKNNSYYNTVITLQGGAYGKKLVLNETDLDAIEYVKLKGLTVCDYPFGQSLTNDIEVELWP